MKKRIIPMALAATMAGATFTACDPEILEAVLSVISVITEDGEERGIGYLVEDEDLASIEDDIMIKPSDEAKINEVTGLPAAVDLSENLPEVGDQGQFGTCVAWATAYNGRTWLYAKSKGLKTSQLNESNTFSPADIFQSLDSKAKGEKCGGTYFEAALDKMVTRGVATLAASPNIKSYSDCSCETSSRANADAGTYKIKSYREVNIKDVNTIKRYLAEGHIVLFGAKLGDNFMNCKSSSVITSNGTFNYTGMHAYHAIVCVGYDESRGQNGAFKVVNSWGENWGAKGFCWVDCKFFCSGDFAYAGFVIYGLNDDDAAPNPPSGGNGESVVVNAPDLQAYKVTDEDYYEKDDPDSDDPTWRTLIYDVYNAGDASVNASSNWGICYLLYNAYNANEFSVVLFDLYSDIFGGVKKGECNENWDENEAKSVVGVQAQGYSLTNIDIPGKSYVCETVQGHKSYFSWSYKLPDVTGSYYLVLMADAFGSVSESNEDNNYYFLTTNDGKPLTIKHGVIQTSINNNKALSIKRIRPQQNENFETQTAVNSAAPNTYSPEEIATLIRQKRQSGEIGNRAMQWKQENGGKSLVKPKKIVSAE